MSSTTELDELHTLIGGLRRCVDSLRSRYGDNPATRRIAIDAEYNGLALDAGAYLRAWGGGSTGFTGAEAFLEPATTVWPNASS